MTTNNSKLFEEKLDPMRICQHLEVSIYQGHIFPEVDKDCCHNVLVSLKIPQWITQRMLHTIFDPYLESKSDDTSQYPKITIHERGSTRMAFIIFTPSGNDAAMIFHMTRRITVHHGSDPKKIASMVFTFARDNRQ